MKPVETVVAAAQQTNRLPLPVRATLIVCGVMCGAVALVSLLSLFFYASFAQWLGEPLNGITRLNPLLVRSMFASAILVYSFALLGCIMMWRRKRKGYKVFAIPAFLLFAASLIFVFSPLILLQLLILAASLLILSLYLKTMDQ